jgi:hypothetical protein
VGAGEGVSECDRMSTHCVHLSITNEGPSCKIGIKDFNCAKCSRYTPRMPYQQPPAPVAVEVRNIAQNEMRFVNAFAASQSSLAKQSIEIQAAIARVSTTRAGGCGGCGR